MKRNIPTLFTPFQAIASAAILGIMMLAGLVGFVFSIRTCRVALQIEAVGVPITGHVTAVYDESEGHGRYQEYTYDVSGRSYTGRTLGRPRDELSYSDRGPITVYYLPGQPEVSNANPHDAKSNAFWAILFLLFWNGFVWSAGIFVFRRIKKQFIG